MVAHPGLIVAVPASFIVIAVVVTLASLVVTPRLMASPAGRYFAERPQDDHLYITSRVLQLAQSKDYRPLLAILGASATRESFFDDAGIARAVKRSSV